MATRMIRMRHICIFVLAAWLLSFSVALATRNIGHLGVIDAGCFVVGAATQSRIAFAEVPIDRLWIILGLPVAVALYAITGDFLGLGKAVSWAIVALSYIAGSRAANLRQMLHQGM